MDAESVPHFRDFGDRWWWEFRKKTKQVFFNHLLSRLNMSIAKKIDVMDAYEEQGLPFGSEAYITVWNQISDEINKFCAKHKVERKTITTQMPKLRDCWRMTQPRPEIPKAPKYLVGTIIGALALGLLLAFIHYGYAIGLRLSHLVGG